MPIVLVGSEYWSRAVDFELLIDEFYINKEDAELVSIIETAEEALAVITLFYSDYPDETLDSPLSPTNV